MTESHGASFAVTHRIPPQSLMKSSLTENLPSPTQESSQAIGVFDSGVGGLTAVRKLVNMLPNERVAYLGDTARVPYGNKTAATVSAYSQECVSFLIQRKVKLVIVACNTASALALEDVQRISPVPVVGVIAPAAEAALGQTRSGKIGIIGTRATVQSGAYQSAIRHLCVSAGLEREISVVAEACPLFVPFAEEGWHYHPATRLVAEEYLAPLKKAQIDTLILGCTHYPMLTDVLQDVLPNVQLINSGEEAVAIADRILHEQGIHAAQRGMERIVECFVTDKSTAFMSVAERFLGFPLGMAEEIRFGKS
jgi:glutamate racemase